MTGEPFMAGEPFLATIGWRLVDAVSQLLDHDEREAVLGDLIEAGEGAWQGLLAVLGLVIWRETTLWKNWRPWLAAFGLALPSTLFLMGFSISVSRTFQQFIDPTLCMTTGVTMDPELLLLMCRVLLLIAWSWSGSFVVGSMSRRTVWVGAALSCIACCFCFTRFGEESLSRLCLFLFLPPAIWGLREGLRKTRIKLGSAIVLAVTVTVLMIAIEISRGERWWSGSPPPLWILNLTLTWPAWYIVGTARRPG